MGENVPMQELGKASGRSSGTTMHLPVTVRRQRSKDPVEEELDGILASAEFRNDVDNNSKDGSSGGSSGGGGGGAAGKTSVLEEPQLESVPGLLWTTLVILAVFYNAVVVPLRLGFRPLWSDDSAKIGIYTFDYLLDIVLWVDIYLNFHWAYVASSGLLVRDRAQLRLFLRGGGWNRVGFLVRGLSPLPIHPQSPCRQALSAWLVLVGPGGQSAH